MTGPNAGSVESVVESHPEKIRGLVDSLDLDSPGLEAVRDAANADDLVRAGREIVAYYEEGDTADWLRSDPVETSDERSPEADPLLDDEFTFQGVTGTAPRVDGSLDWKHTGPRDDDEWAYFLNRHGFFGTLLDACRETGNPEYAGAFDSFVRDWVVSNPPPESERTGYGGNFAWRTLEVGLRLEGHWPSAFYGFQTADAFTPAGRLLMLATVPPQAEYLMEYHTLEHNFTTMELGGVGRAAVCWPEFERAEEWFDHCRDVLTAELDRQVYPDGVQIELTAGYHSVALTRMQSFADRAAKGGYDLPDAFTDGLESMWNYVAYAMRPDGHSPMNNDSNRDYSADDVRDAARTHDRPDWTYVATNGREGERPADPPSRFFPWAGQLVSRSGWDEDAHWSFFDVGPWGTSHQHSDKLHLSVAAGGRDLLVDTGRFAYSGDLAERFRGPYATHSRGHNVVLVDGAGQEPTEEKTDAPAEDAATISDTYDLATGSFEAGFGGVDGKASHDRAVCYRRGEYWVVVDRVRTDRDRTVEPLWHFHPDCATTVEGDHAVTVDEGETNLRVVPDPDLDWRVDVVEGRENPPQGWYSKEYNDAQPAPAAVYETDIESSTTFAWLLVPGTSPTGELSWTEDGDIAVRVDGGDVDHISVDAGDVRTDAGLVLDPR